MARGRLILRSLGSSRKFADARTRAGKLGEFVQALYPLLVACTDDYGRQAGDAFTVKHAVFPTSPRTEAEFEAALNAMHAAGLIVRYVADGSEVIQIVDFGRGQPNLHKRTLSRFPEFSGKSPEIPSQLNLREPKRTEQNPTALRADDGGFSDFWSDYPKKKSKADAERAWRKLAPSPELCQRIKASIAAQRQSFDWQKEDGKYIPFPATWLNGRRWEDEATVIPAPEQEPEVDWFEECQRLHAGRCGGRFRHHQQMRVDAHKAEAS